MNFKTYLILFLVSLIFFSGVAFFANVPGYMDAAYYFATGQQLAQGKGFTEPFIWNYLNPPDQIPHPSHAFWMPLASIVTAIALRLARGFDFASAQWLFALISAFVPPLTAALAFQLNPKRNLALLAAGFALLSAYYIPSMVMTDAFSLYMLFGVLFLLAFRIQKDWLRALLWGLLAGFMHLSRVDGALWLFIGGFTLFGQLKQKPKKILSAFSALFLGYLLVMLPWFLHNLSVFGALTAPGGEKMFWLTAYDQIFAYPSDFLTPQTWLAAGVGEMLAARWWAFKVNFGKTLLIQGEVILFPFIVVAIYSLRADRRVQVGVLGWILTFLAMTLIFPFAGGHGSFLHSGAALQPLWWALAPTGVEKLSLWFSHWRKRPLAEARLFFQTTLSLLLFLFSSILFLNRGPDPLSMGNTIRYEKIEAYLLARTDIQPQDRVMVINSPGYFLASGRPAVALPEGDLQSVFSVAQRYQADYLILEPDGIRAGLEYLLEDGATEKGLVEIGVVDEAKIFAIETH